VAGLGVLCQGVRDGSFWCIGDNRGAGLGQPPVITHSRTPVRFPLREVTQRTSTCALAEGGLYCMSLHRPSFPDPPQRSRELKAVTGLPARVKGLAGGRLFECALLENGEVWCRGSSLNGQIGIVKGATEEERLEYRKDLMHEDFERVDGVGADVERIASGRAHTCALKRDGSVWCWGENRQGQIGNGEIAECRFSADRELLECQPENALVPVRVQGLPRDVASVAASDSTSCVVTRTGSVYCWGIHADGRGGKPTTRPRRAPLTAPVRTLAVGDRFTCALYETGKVDCWGDISAWPGGAPRDWTNPGSVELACR
jgi:alpha-tubulin suppressor-like RCC1 family protein